MNSNSCETKGVFQIIKRIPVTIEIHFFEFGSKCAIKIGKTINPAKSESFPVNWFENVCLR